MGVTFERAAILQWIQQGNSCCPITGAFLREASLRSNEALLWKIRYWQFKQQPNQDTQEGNDHQVKTEALVVVPKRMVCPLTKKIMVDPVMTKYGHNYERAAILKWLVMRGDVCPMTGKPLHISGLVGNGKLAWEIDQWERNSGHSKSYKMQSNDTKATQTAVEAQTPTEGSDDESVDSTDNKVQKSSAFSKKSPDPLQVKLVSPKSNEKQRLSTASKVVGDMFRSLSFSPSKAAEDGHSVISVLDDVERTLQACS